MRRKISTSPHWRVSRATGVLLGAAMALVPSFSHAAYRAFLLKVSAFQASGEPHVYYVATNLDRGQYMGLHGGKKAMEVLALKSWNCPGNTGNRQAVCADASGKVYPRGPFTDAPTDE